MMMDDLFEAPLPGAEPEATEPKPAKAKKPGKAKPAPEESTPANEASAEARTELVAAEAQADAVKLFTDEKRYSQFYERIKEAVSGHSPDLSTAKGRAAIASLAFRVTKSKTALDKAGLGLTEEARSLIAAVNASRKKMVEELDGLAKEIRAPLTAWENAEAARLAKVSAEFERFRLAAIIGEDEDSAALEARGRALDGEELDAELFGEELESANAAKAASTRIIAQAMHRMRQAEKDAAELAQLRAAEEARREEEERKRIEREAEEAAAAARAEEEQRERERAEAEAQRIREAQEQAAQAAREEAELARRAEEEANELARKAEQEERDRQHQAALAEERARTEAAAQEARRIQEENERRETVRLAREEEEKERLAAIAAEEARRASDQAHRRTVAGEAADDIAEAIKAGGLSMKPALDEKEAGAMARVIVQAIAAGDIRHISIKF